MDESEEIFRCAKPLELLITWPIKDALTVSDVCRISDLYTRNRENGFGRAQTPKTDQHLTAYHRILQQRTGFLHTFDLFDGVELITKAGACRQQVFGLGLIAGLIVVSVEVYGVTCRAKGTFFAVSYSQPTSISKVIFRIRQDKHRVGIAQLNTICHEPMKCGIRNLYQPLIVCIRQFFLK